MADSHDGSSWRFLFGEMDGSRASIASPILLLAGCPIASPILLLAGCPYAILKMGFTFPLLASCLIRELPFDTVSWCLSYVRGMNLPSSLTLSARRLSARPT